MTPKTFIFCHDADVVKDCINGGRFDLFDDFRWVMLGPRDFSSIASIPGLIIARDLPDNIGGTLFPFNRIDGAQIQKGVVGTFACCVYMEQIAFLGSGRNEAPSIYMGAAATAQKISTQEIDELLLNYTEAQLATVKMEARNDKAHQHLYVHLPDRTLVYDGAASQVLGEAVWFTLTTTVVGFSQYRARNLVYAYDKWLVGDPQSSNIGYLVDTIGTHWGQKVRWEFGTLI